MTIKDYYNVFNSISFIRPFRCLLLWDGGSVPIIFPGFFIKFWVCDVSLTGRVSRIWGTMGLWATLDCVWDVVDPFIYGTETITKSFFAVKWNQVFKKKCLLPPRSELLFQSFRIFPRFFLFWLISTVTIFQAHFSTNQQTAYTQHHQPPHTLLLVWRNACKHVCLGCIPKKLQSAWTGHKQGAIVSASGTQRSNNLPFKPSICDR